jgi:signal transduction histidine kinase
LLLPTIERHVATNPQAIKTVDMMRQALGGLNHLLGAMREVSYLDADLIKPSMQTIDVGALLRRLSSEYAEKASHLGLRFRVFAPQAFASSDSYLLETTLRYLIENALRFTPSGGVLVGVRRRGERLRIDVVDTGIGVPTECPSEIFEEFVPLENTGRLSKNGFGLGPAIASRQAALLGSNIEIRSRRGRGSRFSLWLPGTPGAQASH